MEIVFSPSGQLPSCFTFACAVLTNVIMASSAIKLFRATAFIVLITPF